MAGASRTINFAERQAGIPVAGVINLILGAGNLRAEYTTGSEVRLDNGTWSYTFLVQEEDLPGGVLLTDSFQSLMVEPYWATLEESEEDACPTRAVICFDSIPAAEGINEGDTFLLLRHDEECDIYCLKTITYDQLRSAILD